MNKFNINIESLLMIWGNNDHICQKENIFAFVIREITQTIQEHMDLTK